MARSAFIVPKEGRWAGDIKAQEWDFRFLCTFRRLPKVLNCTEDAHIKGMSTFETDEQPSVRTSPTVRPGGRIQKGAQGRI
jgi:hypothetical protein